MAHVMDRFHERFGKELPSRQILILWKNKPFRLESILEPTPTPPPALLVHQPKRKRAKINDSISRSPCKSTRKHAAELGNKKSTMQLHIKMDLGLKACDTEVAKADE